MARASLALLLPLTIFFLPALLSIPCPPASPFTNLDAIPAFQDWSVNSPVRVAAPQASLLKIKLSGRRALSFCSADRRIE